MMYEPKWTWLLLRRFALDYLGTDRLPRGSVPVLRTFLGQTAHQRSVAEVLKPYRKRPWVL